MKFCTIAMKLCFVISLLFILSACRTFLKTLETYHYQVEPTMTDHKNPNYWNNPKKPWQSK
ncbi:MAG: hypothetical protein AB1633_06125 [Elusimicrobiota bacterium]